MSFGIYSLDWHRSILILNTYEEKRSSILVLTIYTSSSLKLVFET